MTTVAASLPEFILVKQIMRWKLLAIIFMLLLLSFTLVDWLVNITYVFSGGFMKKILVLGGGCAKCVKTAEFIDKVAKEHGLQIYVIKESSPEIMLKYGVMSTPAVVVH